MISAITVKDLSTKLSFFCVLGIFVSMVSSLQHTANLTNFWGFELLQINMKLHEVRFPELLTADKRR
jgi:hypothetical protein